MQITAHHVRKSYLIHNVYCETAAQTLAACKIEYSMFHEQESLYFEIPLDQFDEVSEQFERPSLLRKGAYTYKQVQHIVQTGNIHQLLMDDNGRIYFREELIGMSVAIAFAQSKWNGATREQAVENAVMIGLNIIGVQFAEEVLEQHQQVEEIEKHIKLSSTLQRKLMKQGVKSGVKKVASAATKKAMYSSAIAKKAMTMFNANIVTGVLVTGVMSSVDIVRMIKGQMSPAQLFKNTSKTAASVAGSMIGLVVGAKIGIAIEDVSAAVVSVVGGILGLLLGSLFASRVVAKLLDLFIKDDALHMLDIFQEQLAKLAEEYLLNEQELSQALNDFNELYNMRQELRYMYASENREVFAQQMIERELLRIVKLRMYLQTPTQQELFEAIERIY